MSRLSVALLAALCFTAVVAQPEFDPDDLDDLLDDIPSSFSLTAKIRDHQEAHPDFEFGSCDPIVDGPFESPVLETLGGDGTPSIDLSRCDGPGQKCCVTSERSFWTWYHDNAGNLGEMPSSDLSGPMFALPEEDAFLNRPVESNLLFEQELQDGVPVYKFESEAFFPINMAGFGPSNKGGPSTNSRNYHFTTQINTQFTYTGLDQVFDFRGDDDVLIFINNIKVCDLFGVHGPRECSVNVTAKAAELGLEPGQNYNMDIFHAERQFQGSNFAATTNIVLDIGTPFPGCGYRVCSHLAREARMSDPTFYSRCVGNPDTGFGYCTLYNEEPSTCEYGVNCWQGVDPATGQDVWCSDFCGQDILDPCADSCFFDGIGDLNFCPMDNCDCEGFTPSPTHPPTQMPSAMPAETIECGHQLCSEEARNPMTTGSTRFRHHCRGNPDTGHGYCTAWDKRPERCDFLFCFEVDDPRSADPADTIWCQSATGACKDTCATGGNCPGTEEACCDL